MGVMMNPNINPETIMHLVMMNPNINPKTNIMNHQHLVMEKSNINPKTNIMYHIHQHLVMEITNINPKTNIMESLQSIMDRKNRNSLLFSLATVTKSEASRLLMSILPM